MQETASAHSGGDATGGLLPLQNALRPSARRSKVALTKRIVAGDGSSPTTDACPSGDLWGNAAVAGADSENSLESLRFHSGLRLLGHRLPEHPDPGIIRGILIRSSRGLHLASAHPRRGCRGTADSPASLGPSAAAKPSMAGLTAPGSSLTLKLEGRTGRH